MTCLQLAVKVREILKPKRESAIHRKNEISHSLAPEALCRHQLETYIISGSSICSGRPFSRRAARVSADRCAGNRGGAVSNSQTRLFFCRSFRFRQF